MSDLPIAMPTSRTFARTSPRAISELYTRLLGFKRDEASVRCLYPWADRFVMGLPLAPWQRSLVWSEEQKVRFIQSIWVQVDIGSYLINNLDDRFFEDADGYLRAPLFGDCVLDGQQRLNALESWFTDEISVPCAAGIPRFWSELPAPEMRRFCNRVFSRTEVSSQDEQELREIYDLRAFGGVAHSEDERASKRMKPPG